MADFNKIRNLDQRFRFITNPKDTEHEVLELQKYPRLASDDWTCRRQTVQKLPLCGCILLFEEVTEYVGTFYNTGKIEF